MGFRAWKRARVRAWSFGPKDGSGKGPYHITITPYFCLSLPWFGARTRLRIGTQHGVQIVAWRESSQRWVVDRQVMGRSKVKGERGAVRKA